MPDPGSIPLADLLSSLSSVVVMILVGAVLFILWQVAILLGVLIANLAQRGEREKGEELLTSLMLPPLQVIAAGVNFCTMLLISRHLFELPFKSISAIASSKTLLRKIEDNRPTPVSVENNKKSRESENVSV